MEFALEGHSYRTGKLDPYTQFAVSRRIAPVIFALGGSVNNVLSKAGDDTLGAIAGAMRPLSEALAGMKDEDANFVLKTCLSVVQRREANEAWANVAAPNGAIMYPDIKMKHMMRLVMSVIKEEIGDFFPTPEDGS